MGMMILVVGPAYAPNSINPVDQLKEYKPSAGMLHSCIAQHRLARMTGDQSQ